jgi:histidine triad (HIT) family protein
VPSARSGEGEDRTIEIVCEDESWTAFFPLEPATPGHTLVIPRTLFPTSGQLQPPHIAGLMTGVLRVGEAISAAINPEGMNVITYAGRAAEQTAFHLHLHVVPRWTQDGFGRICPIEGSKYENADLENVAELIRAECQRTRREA